MGVLHKQCYLGGSLAFLMYCMFNKLNHKILMREGTQRRRCCSRSRCHLKTSLENGFLHFETSAVASLLMALRYSVLQLRKLKPEETQATPVTMTRVCPTLLLACHLPLVLPGKRTAFSGWGWRGHYPAPGRAHLGSTPLPCEFTEPLEDFALCAEVSGEADSYDLSFGKGHFEAAKAKVTGTNSSLKFSLGRDVLKRGVHSVFREIFFIFCSVRN